MSIAAPSPESKLDDLALLASQDYNLGNAGNWFFSFRTGFNGLSSRLGGILFHRQFLYEWELGPLFANHEHHVATILFCMDSALECLVYGLNAFGQAVDPTGFRDVRDPAALRQIAPKDVAGTATAAPKPGWGRLFPQFQQHFSSAAALRTLLVDNHDVSKHRKHSFHGGTFRMDPPPGFFEHLGLGPSDPRQFIFSPMATVSIPREPKLPTDVQPSNPSAWTTLEALMGDFMPFVAEAVRLAQLDAEQTIQLPVRALRET